MIGVAGCVAQAEGEEISAPRARDVDLVFGPQTYHRLPEASAHAPGTGESRGRDRVSQIEEKFRPSGEKGPRPRVTASVP